MGKSDGPFFSIGKDEDDIDFREQLAKHLHSHELFLIDRVKNGDGLRLDHPAQPFPEIVERPEEFDALFRNHFMNRRFEPFCMVIIRAREKKQLHGRRASLK